jgi:hypothetical protein
MGPLALADLIGLDTCMAILKVLQRDLGDHKYRLPAAAEYVAAGWLRAPARLLPAMGPLVSDPPSCVDAALTREFAAAELRPQSERLDREGGLGDDTMAQLAELGFLGVAAPESAGGMGLDRASVAATVAQLAWGEASAGMAVALHAQVTAMVARAPPRRPGSGGSRHSPPGS